MNGQHAGVFFVVFLVESPPSLSVPVGLVQPLEHIPQSKHARRDKWLLSVSE